MVRRLKNYREANNSKIAEPSVSDFFSKNGTGVFRTTSDTPEEKAYGSFKIYIERVRHIIGLKGYIV